MITTDDDAAPAAGLPGVSMPVLQATTGSTTANKMTADFPRHTEKREIVPIQ
jgi:hypothetical protein